MTPEKIKEIENYQTIKDLIPSGSFREYSEIWSIQLHHYLNSAGDVERILEIELCKDRKVYNQPTIKIIMGSPGEMSLYPNSQVCGLGIDDLSEDDWEKLSYHVYDYETSEMEVYCESLRFERGHQTPPLEQ